MAEVGVVVGIDLAVEHGQVTVGEDRQRVEFHQRQVLLVEQLVQAQHDLGQLADLLGGQPQREAQLAALVGLQVLHVVHMQRLDRIRILDRGGLDLDAAIAGGDEGDRLGRAIHQHRQVELLGDVGRRGHQHRIHRQRDAGRLVGFHPGAEHALGVLTHFVEGLGVLDATGLATATGMDLRLDHPGVAADGLGRVYGLLRGARNAPGRYRNAVIGKQLFCLVFVEIHDSPRGVSARKGVACQKRAN